MTGFSNSRETAFDLTEDREHGATKSTGRAGLRAGAGDGIEDLSKRAVLEDWIDGQDVMTKLHISRRTLQTLRSNGTVPYSRIRNKIYYLRQDIERILSDNYIMYKLRERYGKDI